MFDAVHSALSALEALVDDGFGPGWLLLSAAALFFAWDGWRRNGQEGLQRIWLAAACFVGCALIWLVLGTMARFSGLTEDLWLAPMDRLVGAGLLAGLAWILGAAPSRRWWRAAVAAGFAVAVIAYAGFAPGWAREAQAAGLHNRTLDFAHSWDALQLILTAALGLLIWREQQANGSRWLPRALMLLGIGAFLQWLFPLGSGVPVWWRLGTLAASGGLCLAGVAGGLAVPGSIAASGFARLSPRRPEPAAKVGPSAVRSPILDTAPLRLPLPVPPPEATPDASSASSHAARMEAAQHVETARRAETTLPVPDLDLGLGPDLVVGETLQAMVLELGAIPAIFVLNVNDDVLDGRAVTVPNRAAKRVGPLQLDHCPTLVRAIAEGRLALDAVSLAPDVQDIFVQVGLPATGPILVQGLAEADGHPAGVLIAGKLRGRFTEWDRAQLERLARRAALRLTSLSADAEARGHLGRVLAALETQADAVTQLERAVGVLVDRIRHLEDHVEQPPAPAAPEPVAPAPVAAIRTDLPAAAAPQAFADRVARYEQTLDRLPWGVVVSDAAGGVAFANNAAAQLLHVEKIAHGGDFIQVFPEPERMDYTLHRLRSAALQMAAEGGGMPPRALDPIATLFDSPSLRVDLEALYEPALGYLGAVAVLHPLVDSASIFHSLVPALADALRSPITSILGYSDLLAHGSGYSEDLLRRFVHRIDANLSRMQVMLNNLLIAHQIDIQRTPVVTEPVNVEAAVQTAVHQAQPQFDEKALSVKVAIDGPLPTASADPGALAQIIDNLLVNAALRSPQGGDVTVSARVQEASGARAVVISVHDRGQQPSGSTLGVMEIDDTADPSPVWLTIVRLLAEQQGGKAWAESDPQGARFHVRLPVRRAA